MTPHTDEHGREHASTCATNRMQHGYDGDQLCDCYLSRQKLEGREHMTSTPEDAELLKLCERMIAALPYHSAVENHLELNGWVRTTQVLATALKSRILSPAITPERLVELEAEVTRLKSLVHVPGQWRCAKCKFVVHKMVLCAKTGDVGLKADTVTEPCPNGCGPLWPRTWKDDAFECGTRLEQQHDEIVALKAALTASPATETVAREELAREIYTVQAKVLGEHPQWDEVKAAAASQPWQKKSLDFVYDTADALRSEFNITRKEQP